MKKFRSAALVAALALGMAWPALAHVVERVQVPDTRTVSGQPLILNGAGLRTATLLHVKVYVAAFYAPQPLRTPEEVYASSGPLRFDFIFLRAVGKKKVSEAWNWQFTQSCDSVYPHFEADRDAFVQSFDSLQKGESETVEIEGNETRLYDKGVLRNRISGHEFQKLFLGVWFGPKPVMPELKKELLAGGKASCTE